MKKLADFLKSKSFRVGVIILTLIAFALYTMDYFYSVKVQASQDTVSIALSTNSYQLEEIVPDEVEPTLDIRFEPSGTHVDSKGNLKIRLDFYPGPEDKSYSMHHVYVIDETSIAYLAGYPGKVDKSGQPLDAKAYQAWLDSLPHVWRTNPALCHFLTVKPDITKLELDTMVKQMFTANVTATIDDAVTQVDSSHLLSPYMRTKTSTTTAKIAPTDDKASLVDAVNTRLADYKVVDSNYTDGTVEQIEPKSIDVGPGAIDGTSTTTAGTTRIDSVNSANADGTLDTMELWAESNITGAICGTFSGSGTSYDDRDYESIGAITAGSKQTFSGLNCDVVTGDFLGLFFDSGYIERYAGTGYYFVSGNKFGSGSATYTWFVNYSISIYATGTESGGTYDITNSQSSVSLGTVAVSATYWSNGSAPSGNLDDAEAYFTITSTGSAATDIDFHGHNASGGVGWTLTSSAPGENQYRVAVYKEGDDTTGTGTYLTTSDQEIISALASGANIDAELKIMTGSSFTDGVQKSFVVTITGRAP